MTLAYNVESTENTLAKTLPESLLCKGHFGYIYISLICIMSKAFDNEAVSKGATHKVFF